jgi:predicted RNase H-like HicB family nuclease
MAESHTTAESQPSTAPTPPATVHPVTVTVQVRLQALAVQEADGRYSVIVPALPGCVTQGDDIEEVKANIVEAAEGWLSVGFDLHREKALKLVTE